MFRSVLKWLDIAVGVLAVLCVLGACAIFGPLWYQNKVIPNQGEILNVLPETKFLNDESLVLFFKGGSLYSVGLDGSVQRKLCDDVGSYRWSPDGRKVVAKTGALGSDERIVIIDLNTGEKDIVEDLETFDVPRDEWYSRLSLPEWAPDGTKLAYCFNKERYKRAVRIYDVNARIRTGIERPLSYVIGPKWTIDGRYVLFNELFTKRYYKYDLSSEVMIELLPEADLSNITWYDIVDINNVHFNQYATRGVWHRGRTSPNGRYRAFNREGSLWLEKHGEDVLLVEFKGTYNPDFGQAGVGGIAWLPNDRVVLFDFSGKDPKRKMYAVDIETKKVGYLAEGGSPTVHIPDFRPADLNMDKPSIMSDTVIYMRDR